MANFNRYITAAAIVQRACRVMGLPVPTTPSGATDSTSVQLWALLTECGQEIMSQDFEWQIINKTYDLTIQDPVLEYPFPEDLQQFIDSSGWNITSRIPLIGPLTTQQWQLLQARQLGGTTLRLQFIIEAGVIKFYWAPSDPNDISISYQSRAWVQDDTDPNTYRDYVENDADLVLFEASLMVKKLILEFRKKKGFPTADDQDAYDKALEAAKYNDRPKLDLSTSGSSNYPYLGYLNMPDTNYGA
jgi:hypothetical protein